MHHVGLDSSPMSDVDLSHYFPYVCESALQKGKAYIYVVETTYVSGTPN